MGSKIGVGTYPVTHKTLPFRLVDLLAHHLRKTERKLKLHAFFLSKWVNSIIQKKQLDEKENVAFQNADLWKKYWVEGVGHSGCLCVFECAKKNAASVNWTTRRCGNIRVFVTETDPNHHWHDLLQGVDYCLQSRPPPPNPPPPCPNASDSVSHLFSATAICHGPDTRVLLQRNPYNRLTVIKETSLPSNKISNFQLPGTPSS